MFRKTLKEKSKEVGDKPGLHDVMFNFIPGSCFEIGASLSILDNPGKAGEEVDHFVTIIKSIIEKSL